MIRIRIRIRLIRGERPAPSHTQEIGLEAVRPRITTDKAVAIHLIGTAKMRCGLFIIECLIVIILEDSLKTWLIEPVMLIEW